METAQAGGRTRVGAARRRGRGDRGVALVEFAIIMPVLFALLFAVIEFGSAYFQQLDIRHGAREGVRLLAVNATPTNAETSQVKKIAREACTRMDVDAGTTVQMVVALNGGLVADPGGDATPYDIGDEVTITVSKELDQVTGFLDIFLKDITITSTVKTRLEQAATYGNLTAGDNFTC